MSKWLGYHLAKASDRSILWVNGWCRNRRNQQNFIIKVHPISNHTCKNHLCLNFCFCLRLRSVGMHWGHQNTTTKTHLVVFLLQNRREQQHSWMFHSQWSCSRHTKLDLKSATSSSVRRWNFSSSPVGITRFQSQPCIRSKLIFAGWMTHPNRS